MLLDVAELLFKSGIRLILSINAKMQILSVACVFQILQQVLSLRHQNRELALYGIPAISAPPLKDTTLLSVPADNGNAFGVEISVCFSCYMLHTHEYADSKL